MGEPPWTSSVTLRGHQILGGAHSWGSPRPASPSHSARWRRLHGVSEADCRIRSVDPPFAVRGRYQGRCSGTTPARNQALLEHQFSLPRRHRRRRAAWLLRPAQSQGRKDQLRRRDRPAAGAARERQGRCWRRHGAGLDEAARAGLRREADRGACMAAASACSPARVRHHQRRRTEGQDRRDVQHGEPGQEFHIDPGGQAGHRSGARISNGGSIRRSARRRLAEGRDPGILEQRSDRLDHPRPRPSGGGDQQSRRTNSRTAPAACWAYAAAWFATSVRSPPRSPPR